MSKLIFIWWLVNGTLTPAGDHEGHQMYTIWYKDGKVIDYAYKGEVLNYIRTGTFEYNDFYEWPDEILDKEVYTNNGL